MNGKYELIPVQAEEHKLFFRLDGDPARFGAIGYLRGDFDTGKLFYTTWFDNQVHLKSEAFKTELDNVVNFLRKNPEAPVLKSRADMRAYCRAHPEQHMDGDWQNNMTGFKTQTADYSFYIRCTPREGDYDLYIFCFDNRYLLPELAGQHELPKQCFSVLPSSGGLILISRDEPGYISLHADGAAIKYARTTADEANKILGVTRAQEEAMLAGSMMGWNTPAAKPWNYEIDGTPCDPSQPRKNDHVR
jgi:hypothetical protein